MNNILLSEFINNANCFNCNSSNKNTFCNCEYNYNPYYDYKTIIFNKFLHVVLVKEHSENEYIIKIFEINCKKIIIKFIVNNITLQELFDKIETSIIFQ